MVGHSCIASFGLEEPHEPKLFSITVYMSLQSTAKPLSCLMSMAKHPAPRIALTQLVSQYTSLPNMTLLANKEEFLSNQENKQQFITLLSQMLERGCEIHQVRGDADTLIVQTVLASASMQDTVLVYDTDLSACASDPSCQAQQP